jgi:hypothetical protein
VLILRTELAAQSEEARARRPGVTSLDLARRAGEQQEPVSPDLLRAVVQTFAEAPSPGWPDPSPRVTAGNRALTVRYR